MRGFLPNLGAGGTGYLKTGITSEGTTRTFLARCYMDPTIGNFARLLSKQATSEILRIAFDNTTASIHYGHSTDTGFKQWYSPALVLVGGERFYWGASHDMSSVSNAPTLYVNGSASTAVFDASSGSTYTTNTDAYMWGNRETDFARPWSAASEMAIYDVILTAEEHAAFASGVSPKRIRPTGLISYIRGDRQVVDEYANGLSSSDNTYVADTVAWQRSRRRRVTSDLVGGSPPAPEAPNTLRPFANYYGGGRAGWR